VLETATIPDRLYKESQWWVSSFKIPGMDISKESGRLISINNLGKIK
jgi:hypothetical protein